MQQKSKSIIFLTLICFISLLFLPRGVWGLTDYPFPAGGTPSDCTTDTKKCVDGYSEWHPASGTPGTDSYFPGGYDFVCTEWETLIEGDPSCAGGGNGGEEEEFKDRWKCTCDGIQSTCHKSNTGSSSKAKCEECCPCAYHNICRKSNWAWLTGNQTLYCKTAKWCEIKEEDECQTDADCDNGETTTPTSSKYSCNTSNWICSEDSSGVYSSLSVCEDNCVEPSGPLSCPGNDYCYACNKSTYQCYKDSAGPYTTLNMCKSHCRAPSTGPTSSPPPSEPSPCMIHYFELPERAWVGYPITGTWSASAWCDDCDVDCMSYPECVWKQDNIGTGFDEYKFTLEQSGTYDYTLTCYGEGGIDERTETATVEALNLPWWREIIPVLRGFLGGGI